MACIMKKFYTLKLLNSILAEEILSESLKSNFNTFVPLFRFILVVKISAFIAELNLLLANFRQSPFVNMTWFRYFGNSVGQEIQHLIILSVNLERPLVFIALLCWNFCAESANLTFWQLSFFNKKFQLSSN